MLAVPRVEADAERPLHPFAECGERGQPGALGEPGERVARVGREEERHVGGLGQRCAGQQAAPQEVGEADAEPFRPRAACERPEALLVGGEVEALRHRTVGPHEAELPEVGREDNSVGVAVAPNLLARDQ